MPSPTITDTDFAAFNGDRCVGIAYKFAGPGADEWNAETLEDWSAKGYDVRELPRGDACAAHHAALGPDHS